MADYDFFEYMGRPIGFEARRRGLEAVRAMAPDMKAGDAYSLVQRVASALELDDPYGAQRAGISGSPSESLDLIGTYRLMATLLAGIAAESSKEAINV